MLISSLRAPVFVVLFVVLLELASARRSRDSASREVFVYESAQADHLTWFPIRLDTSSVQGRILLVLSLGLQLLPASSCGL